MNKINALYYSAFQYLRKRFKILKISVLLLMGLHRRILCGDKLGKISTNSGISCHHILATYSLDLHNYQWLTLLIIG